ncbi:MAG: LacI family DNA-binding transcriptional regulator [Propionibacteriaceae bacterium]
MQDVARVAGVSHQTVSRVLNGHPRVRPETRDRVLAVIADLGYRRNSAARALVTSRSGTIGLLTPRSILYGPVSTLISVEEAARTAGLFVSVASLRNYDASSVTAALDHFMDQGVEGIIVIAPVPEAVRVASELASQVPMVLIAADTASGPGYQTASVDQELGARLATRHLIDLGHAEIAHVSGPADWLDARARRRGWERELLDAALVDRPPIDGGWTAEGGFRAGQHLLAEEPPSAVFAANDLMALGLIRAFTEAGLHVPSDISVVGFDDIDGASHYLPPLTTVRQDFSALGERCVELLRGQLAEDETPSTVVMAPELIVRASTTNPSRRIG